jgi:putative (di)nucleoside polyphosphate hydrolase
MQLSPEKLGYRDCVGVMLLNSHGLVWIGHRPDQPDEEGAGQWWQMPQGGIDRGEDPRDAAIRELREETGVRSAKIIAEAPRWYYYDLPHHLVGISWGGRYRGQRQRWFAFRFLGEDAEVDLTPKGHKAEFDRWRWAAMDDLEGLIVPFKRKVYREVVRGFRHLVTAAPAKPAPAPG